MKKAKNIIGSIFVMAVMLMLMGTATQSYFSDTETSTGNKFTAGTLDLNIDAHPDGGTFVWVDDDDVPTMNDILGSALDCLKPGDSGTLIVGIRNRGCVAGIADIHITVTASDENQFAEPEADDGGGATGDGELAESIDVVISYGDKMGTASTGDDVVTEIASGTLEELHCNNFYSGVILEGEGEDDDIGDYWVIQFSIDGDTVGNEIMTDSVTFDIEFSLTQAEDPSIP